MKERISTIPTATPTESSAVPELSKAELNALLADSSALRDLAKGKLVQIIHKSDANTSLVPAIKELLDRVDGKPHQSVDVSGKIGIVQIVLEAAKLRNERPLLIDNPPTPGAVDK